MVWSVVYGCERKLWGLKKRGYGKVIAAERRGAADACRKLNEPIRLEMRKFLEYWGEKKTLLKSIINRRT